MTKLSKTILDNYQIRKNKSQKTDFINLISNHFDNVQVEQGGLLRSRNIVIGDISNAKFVCGAHYDACAVMPFPNFITPKNIFFYLIYCILICIPVFIITGGVSALTEKSSNTLYPSDQANFPVHIGVAAFNKKKFIGYYLDKIHASKDTVLDERNIEYLKNSILNLTYLILM